MSASALGNERAEPVSTSAGVAPIARHTITDSETYTAAVSGPHVEAVQLGCGSGPTVIRTMAGERIVATSGSARIPIAHYSTLPDDVVTIALIHAASPGSNWCGIDLAPGTVLVYSPSVEHTGVDQPGLEFTFAVATLDHLQASAERIEVPFTAPERGKVRAIHGEHQTRTIVRGLGALATSLRNREAAADGVEDDVVCAMVDVLATTSTSTDRGTDGSARRSRVVTRRCLDYAESIGRMPSIGQLCLAAGVSERWLRSAFVAEFGLSPARFFRIWALDKAHNRLVRSNNGDVTVSQVAADLGFEHLGRFSRYFRDVYEVTPSMMKQAAVPESGDRDGPLEE